MVNSSTLNNVAHPFWPVKSPGSDIGSYSPNSMRHHKSWYSKRNNLIVSYSKERGVPYDVSSDHRILTKGMFNKHFDEVRRCLRDVVKLSAGEFQAILVLLRLWAYYGQVYPKAEQVCFEAGCSKATFWRAVMYLKSLGLIKTIPRFRLDPHAKISSLYKLDKLLIVIAKYLAEHTAHVWHEWLMPYLRLTWPQLWQSWVLPLGVPLQCAHIGSQST